jgi:hypothetical protein
VRFGIGPRLAGESGAAQTVQTVPEDPAKRDAALRRLRDHRFFAVRLNRLFMADGEAGISQFQALARHFARLGLDVELQVRYHPAPADDGNIAKWVAYVRRVVRAFGPIRRVTGLQITNEVNIAVSPNTSDGAYRRAVDALVEGVVAAKRESRRLGYDHQKIGFNYAWRFDFLDPQSDTRFWRRSTAAAGGACGRTPTGSASTSTRGPSCRASSSRRRSRTSATRGWRAWPRRGSASCPRPASRGAGPCASRRPGTRPAPGAPSATRRRRPPPSPVPPSLPRHLQHQRLPLLRPARQQQPGPTFQQYFGLLRDDYSEKPAFEVYRRAVARTARVSRAGKPSPSGRRRAAPSRAISRGTSWRAPRWGCCQGPGCPSGWSP